MALNPELVRQLVNPDDARLSAGSNVRVLWRCPRDARHVWTASPNARRKVKGCPVCANRVIMAGVNDLASTHPVLARELVDAAAGAQLHGGTHAVVDWVCPRSDQHRWAASVVSRTSGPRR